VFISNKPLLYCLSFCWNFPGFDNWEPVYIRLYYLPEYLPHSWSNSMVQVLFILLLTQPWNLPLLSGASVL